MQAIPHSFVLTALLVPMLGLPACAGDDGAGGPSEVAALPRGSHTALLTEVTDGCALHLAELTPGRSLAVVLDLDPAEASGGVTVIVPGTSLPRLSSPDRQSDRFRTASRQVPITAQDGRCSALRTQYFEGRVVPPAAYHLIYHSDDDMKMGECGLTPLPCRTTATMSIRFCPSPTGCGASDGGS